MCGQPGSGLCQERTAAQGVVYGRFVAAKTIGGQVPLVKLARILANHN